ncbi:hypothetical protein [Parasitella parasitica]|uniref:Uncharacterized protein n=1 Tax=Parasitella parasitica TaxID=35722 RepID=A0A0B7N7U7_9FUNG|nr:hypothetical protein [Parasitella parasitica]
MPQQQPMFMTPTQMHPQLVTGVAPYYIEETSLWARQEMERRRVLAKEEKYRRSQYQKALQQEKQRMSLVQSAKASNEAAAAAAAAAGVNTNATANTNAAAPIATNTPSANNNAVQQ